MDEILAVFPFLGQDIFNQLNAQSLDQCRDVSKFWRKFLDNNSLFWKRRIQKITQNQRKFKKDWKLVTTKVSTDTLKELAFAVEEFSTQNYYKYAYQFSPVHVLAYEGMLLLYKKVVKKTRVINPADNYEQTPLHFAAEKGHLELVQFPVNI